MFLIKRTQQETCINYFCFFFNNYLCQSQCPSGLRRGCAAARLLWLRVRIPLGTWMSVSCIACSHEVEVSTMCRSPVRRNPTDCGVPLIVIKCDTRRWVAKTGVTKKIDFLVAAYVVVQHAFATSSVNEKIARKAMNILIFTSLANIN